jgi:hypothetical protein
MIRTSNHANCSCRIIGMSAAGQEVTFADSKLYEDVLSKPLQMEELGRVMMALESA